MALKTDNHINEGLIDTQSFRTQAIVQDTAAGTLALTSSSEELIIFTGTTSGQILSLTDATTIQKGHRYEVHNNSTKDISIRDNTGTTLNTLLGGQRLFLALQEAGTQAGTWSIVEAEKITGQTSGTVTSLFNDFILDVFHTHSMIIDSVLNGGVATMDTSVTDNTYSGSFTLSTGTTVPNSTTFGKAMAMNNDGLIMMAGGQSIEWRVRIPVLSGNSILTPRFDIKTGLQDTDLIGDPNNGIYFQYSDSVNGGMWTGVTRNNSISTTVPSSVSVVANTWYRVKFIVNTSGTSVDFYIDDVFIGNSISNIPRTNACRLQASIEKKSFNSQTFLPAAVNATSNLITINNHGFSLNDRVIFSTTTTLPSPLSASTIYYVVSPLENTFAVSTSSGGGSVNITTQGTGTHTISEVSGTSSSAQWDWYIYSITRI